MGGRMYPDDDTIKHFTMPKSSRYKTHGSKWDTEIRYDDPSCTTVDEIVTTQVHLEMMDVDACWMSINGVHVWFRATKGKLIVTCFGDDARPIVITPEMSETKATVADQIVAMTATHPATGGGGHGSEGV